MEERSFEEFYRPVQVALAKKLAADDRKVLALYGQVLREVRKKIEKLYGRYAKNDGKLDNADKSMADRLLSLNEDIQRIMNEKLPGIVDYQAKLTGEMYEESFYRHCWAIDKGGTMGLSFGMVPRKAVENAVKGSHDTFAKSRLLLEKSNAVERLKEDVGLALIRGDSYQTLAGRIALHIGVDEQSMKKVRYLHKGMASWSMLVARTEGQRVIAEGQMDAYSKARELGCEIEVVWDATLDARTRPEHAALDQQVKDEAHGGWYVKRLGRYVSAPLHSGDPSFDINCRCRVTARVKYLKEGSAGEAYTYKEWKEAQEAFDKVPADDTGWKRSFDVFREPAEEAARKINPHFGEGAKWENNCQRCVQAYEMRRRGYDVQAKPMTLDKHGRMDMDDAVLKNWKNVFENASWEQIGINEDDLAEIRKQMGKWGDGSRSQICVTWPNGRGHVFSAEQIGGETVFIDPQNSHADTSEYFRKLKKGCTMFARVDQLKPTKLIKECCFPYDHA